ncbi:Adenylate kinase isoenzyme 6 [Balamuthia mandrillaris]
MDLDGSQRTLPNILITGTPGTGKTSLSSTLAANTGLKHIEVGTLIREKELHDGRDEEFDCFILNEDKLCDELEDTMTKGGNIVDFHGCDFFPERWFDLVVVLRTDNSVLYPRLEGRSYTPKKIQENVECEIMQVVLDEARESYAEHVVMELASNTLEEMDHNLEVLETWIKQYKASKSS